MIMYDFSAWSCPPQMMERFSLTTARTVSMMKWWSYSWTWWVYKFFLLHPKYAVIWCFFVRVVTDLKCWGLEFAPKQGKKTEVVASMYRVMDFGLLPGQITPDAVFMIDNCQKGNGIIITGCWFLFIDLDHAFPRYSWWLNILVNDVAVMRWIANAFDIHSGMSKGWLMHSTIHYELEAVFSLWTSAEPVVIFPLLQLYFQFMSLIYCQQFKSLLS